MRYRKASVLTAIATIGVAATVAFLLFLPQYAVWGELVAGVAIVIGIFAIVDRLVLDEIDTVKEIKKGNVAYALLLVAIAILVLAAAIVVG